MISTLKMGLNMPPPVKEPATFLGWIEDLFKIPVEYPRETWAIVRKNYDNKIFVLRVNQLPSAIAGSFSDSDFISSLLEGPESISDIKGVTSSITIKDLISSPRKTVVALGTSTFNQIIDLDELDSDRRADMLGRLARGQVTDGEDSRVPNSSYVDAGEYLGQIQAFGIKKAGDLIDTTTRTSRIQLLKDSTNGTDPNGKGDWEDRRTIEENESRQSKWKSYSGLAGALTQLGSQLEDPSGRKQAVNNIYNEYTRSIVREIGIDLDKVLGTLKYSLTEAKIAPTGAEIGRLSATLRTGTTIEQILENDALTASVLGLSLAEFSTYAPKEQALLRSFLSIEDINIRTSFYNPIVQEPEILMQKLKESGANYSTVFDGKDYAIGMKSPALGAPTPSKQSQLVGYRDRSFFKSDVTNLQNKHLITAYAQAENDYRQIRKNIRDQINTRYATLPQADRNTKINRALARLDDARRATKIADDLFYVSTFKEILENIEQGSFLRAALQSTRFLNLIPGTKFKSGSDFSQLLSTGRVWGVRHVADFLGDLIPTVSGLKVSDKKELKLGNTTIYKRKGQGELNPLGQVINKATGIFEGHSYASWATRDAAGNFLNKQKFVRIKTVDAQGIFGEWSVHNVLKQMDSAGFWDGAGNAIPGLPAGLNSAEILADFTKLDSFYANLQMAANWCLANPDPTIAPQLPATFRPYVIILREFGIVAIDPATGIFNLSNIDKIFDQKALFDMHGKVLLEKLGNPAVIGNGALRTLDRWGFIKKIGANGIASDLTKKYSGLFTTWNRFANFGRNYLYQNIILGTQFGTALLNVPIVGSLLKLGGGEIGLLEIVNKWNWVKNTKATGTILKRLTGNPKLLARIAGRSTSSFLLRTLASNATGKLLMKIAGNLLLQASNVLTGGLSWVLAAFGDVAWKFGKNALKLNFKKAYYEAKEALDAKWEVVKKVIIYPLACGCGCVIAPIGLIIIVIASQLANFSPFGGGSYKDTESKMLSVQKTASFSGTDILYTVTITNISQEDAIDVETISDTLNFTFPCPSEGESGATVSYPNNTAEYTWDVINFPENKAVTITKTAPLVFTYTVKNDKTKGTYFNFIEVTAKNEPNKSATASIGTDLPQGPGCVTCPSGWPFSNLGSRKFAVTQGPGGSWSHTTAEAVDIAPSNFEYNVNNGQQISATHRGTVYFALPASSGEYGNLAVVRSPKGFSTYYAHLDRFNPALSNGQVVDAGTILGIMGTTGNSTGFHLHYEFRNPGDTASFACIPGHDLSLINIPSTENYVPKTITRSCVEVAGCGNIIIP